MPRCRSYQPIYVSKKKATRARKTIFVCSLPEIISSDVRIFVFHLSIWTTLHRQEKKEYKKYTKEEKMVVGYPQPHGYLLMFLPSWRGTRCQIYVHTFFFCSSCGSVASCWCCCSMCPTKKRNMEIRWFVCNRKFGRTVNTDSLSLVAAMLQPYQKHGLKQTKKKWNKHFEQPSKR